MGWETRKGRGRYYTRSKRQNGRVVREYVGTGAAAELAASLDEENRRTRQAEARRLQAEQAAMQALENDVAEVCKLTDLAARIALIATGHHRHHRGEWRRKRGKETGSGLPSRT